jgi:hypothetical protein
MSDLRADLTALLDKATADGSKVIAIEAVYRALGEPVDPPTAHQIVFGDAGWSMRHPAGCDTAACRHAIAARRSLVESPYTPGRYEVALGPGGGLAFTPLASTSGGGGT